MIIQKDGKWCVYSEDGERSFGCYQTEEEAKKRLGQVEYFKRNGKYDDIDFTPPQGVRDAYKRGIDLHEEGKTGDGLEASTVAMAKRLASGENVSPAWARKANRFWGRNERFLDEPKDSAAYASAMLWGGRPGKTWYSSLVEKMNKADGVKTNYVQVINQINTVDIRNERDDAGDEIIILGGYTMPDDIVMNRIMYPKEEIEASYRGLEGIPAPIGHPHDSDGNYVSASSEIGVNRFQHGAFVGKVERRKGRIYIETRINKRKASETQQGKRLLRSIDDIMLGASSDPIHTSTGVYLNSQVLPQTRTCERGKEYDQIARNLVFDHNAILLDEEGAATPSDGVGMLVNKGKQDLQVMRVNCEFAQTETITYDSKNNHQEDKNMALRDMLLGFLKANKVDVAEDATDESLLNHLNAMQTNGEIEQESIDFNELAANAAKDAFADLSDKIEAISLRLNEMDDEEKAELMKKLKDNGYEDEKLEKMSLSEMKKAVSQLAKNQEADYSQPDSITGNSAKSDSLTTSLEDW